MSKWTHALCWKCWRERHGDRAPFVVVGPIEPEPCCACGEDTTAGIYYRESPDEMKCKGKCEI